MMFIKRIKKMKNRLLFVIVFVTLLDRCNAFQIVRFMPKIYRRASCQRFQTSCSDAQQQGLQMSRDFSMLLLKKREQVGALNMDRHHKQPSALLPPHRAVQVQLEALQMNDWPDVDAGCKHAYRFAVRANNYLFGSVGKPFMLKPGKSDPSILADRLYIDPHFDDRHIAKSWLGVDRLEDEESFVKTLKTHFLPLIGADGFEWAGPPQFRADGAACTVAALVHGDKGTSHFAFDLVRVTDGAYKDCW
jgi:hypothetical protein